MNTIFSIHPAACKLSLYDCSVPAGFPSPAADYMQDEIDFNKILVQHPNSTFVVRVSGDSMVEANIPDGAYLIVDRSVRPKNGSIIVAVLDGEFTVKRYEKTLKGFRLLPANKKYHPIDILEGMEFQVWGVVTNIIVNAANV